MPAPAFEFTDRATPIVQMGRAEQRTLGNDTWGQAHWGVAHWGKKDWEPIWTDLTCEIHEINTDTGRGGATDRFRPGTAHIVASNVNRISQLIFPPIPAEFHGAGFEFVPQPPITNEEELQASNAATLVSNGWSFSDDFERVPPKWILPPAWATSGVFAPTVMFRVCAEAFEPEMHYDIPNLQYVANGAAQWTRTYPADGDSEITVDLTDLDWLDPIVSGDPETVVELYLRMNQTDKECYCARVRFVPKFGGAANEIHYRLLHMAADGSEVDGGGSAPTVPIVDGTGTNGVFGPRRLRFFTNVFGGGFNQLGLEMTGTVTRYFTPADMNLPGGRVGLSVHYESGRPPVYDHWHAPRIERITGEDFDDDLTFPLGSGWHTPPSYVPSWGTPSTWGMYAFNGQLWPTTLFLQNQQLGKYGAEGMTQFVTDFDGDQFVEVELGDISWPHQVGGGPVIKIYTQSNARNLGAMVVEIGYDNSRFGDNVIWWAGYKQGPYGETVDYGGPDYDSTAINLGETAGEFPSGERWRVESDTLGEQRVYRNGTLVSTAMAATPAVGGRIGVGLSWDVHDTNGVSGPAPGWTPPGLGIKSLSAGLREPLGTEELGMWIRIGVNHATLGEKMFFRGFVDAVVPTYVPDRPDAVRIEAFDSLGEAGRVFVDGDRLPHRFAGAPNRIHQILNGAHWPGNLRSIRDDSTIMSRPAPGKAVDLLTHVAESCGGAVYGDPVSGDIVFKGQDWQGVAAGLESQAFITNYRPDVDDGIPRVCPTGWEHSARRSDMLTRVRLSSVTSDTDDGEPIVKEWRGPGAEYLYGVELYERTLLCITGERLNELAIRQLHLRHPNQFPRVEAVLLDASTADEALDLMTEATFTRPSKYQCQLRRDGEFVFNRRMLVTGVRHRMSPTRWTCRLALDPSSVFLETGGRWGRARWGKDVWGATR